MKGKGVGKGKRVKEKGKGIGKGKRVKVKEKGLKRRYKELK